MPGIAAALTTAAMLGGPSAAVASGSSTCQAYNPQLCGPVSRTLPSTHAGGGLPFTGLDLSLLVAGGILLTGTGTLVRRLARSAPAATSDLDAPAPRGDGRP